MRKRTPPSCKRCIVNTHLTCSRHSVNMELLTNDKYDHYKFLNTGDWFRISPCLCYGHFGPCNYLSYANVLCIGAYLVLSLASRH